MKQKRNYSLTAKERKAKRMAEENKKQRKAAPAEADASIAAAPTREQAEQAMIVAQKRSRRSALIVGGICMLAIILILVALIVPVIMYIVNPYRGYKQVIARFNLSNGMVLEYVIEEDEYPTAATNFIFLAKNGYFDNTVFYDAQNGWLRFGGYENQPATGSYTTNNYSSTNHHKDNTTYCKNFTALANSKFDTPTRKFGYRLRSDSNGTEARLLNQEGVLAFLYSDTSTEFQFSYQEQATNDIRNTDGKSYELSPTMVGHALNAKTLSNIKAITATAQQNTGIVSGYLWRPPTPDIRIASVKVYNLNASKWDGFDFIKYMKDNNAVSQWINVV